MALSVITSFRGRIWEFHISEPLPQSFGEEEVTVVQADGDELNWILHTFTGIPTTDQRVQRWFGDHAKFIYHNLKW